MKIETIYFAFRHYSWENTELTYWMHKVSS